MVGNGLFLSEIKTFNDPFVHILRDIYYAESQIVKAPPKMIDKATDSKLKQGFETQSQGDRDVDRRHPFGSRLHSSEIADKNVLDAALNAAAQPAALRDLPLLVLWAELLSLNDCAALLRQNLEEEQAADATLNSLRRPA